MAHHTAASGNPRNLDGRALVGPRHVHPGQGAVDRNARPRSTRCADRCCDQSLLMDGRPAVLQRADLERFFLFEPIEFLEKLTALIPRPAVNLLLYHGVLAPRRAGARRSSATAAQPLTTSPSRLSLLPGPPPPRTPGLGPR